LVEEKAAKVPPAFSYRVDHGYGFSSSSSTFSNCFATEVRPEANRAFRGARFHISPDLPEGITLDPKTGFISGTYSKDVAKDEKGPETTNGKDAEEDGQDQKDIVKRLVFQVKATNVGKQAHTNFNMKLELKHKCPAASFTGASLLRPSWVALLCFALLLCAILMFCCICAGKKKVPAEYSPLTKE